MPHYIWESLADNIGLVHIVLPTSIRTVVALRHRGHFLRRILVPPPHGLPRSAKHQYTSTSDAAEKDVHADQDSGTISKRKILDLHPPTHRAPRNARIASSTRSVLAESKHRSPAIRIAGPRTRLVDKSCRLTARIYTSLRIMATYTVCCSGRTCCQTHLQKKC
jgi:hypothetical protein